MIEVHNDSNVFFLLLNKLKNHLLTKAYYQILQVGIFRNGLALSESIIVTGSLKYEVVYYF